jgi:hypothetical protein
MYVVSQDNTVLAAVRLPSTSALKERLRVGLELTVGQPQACPKSFCALAVIVNPAAITATEKRKRFINIINKFKVKRNRFLNATNLASQYYQPPFLLSENGKNIDAHLIIYLQL